MKTLTFTILGCGSSGGVPRIGGDWGACDKTNPKNARLRCSMLIQRHGADGVTSVLIDTSPDMRSQLLAAEVGALDAVVYTHQHADHVHGLDDLRMIALRMRKRIPVYASTEARGDILSRFNYAFETPEGSSYPPILEMYDLPENLWVDGAGGKINIQSFDVEHGAISVRALRINDLLYTPDISGFSADVEPHLSGLHYWVLDALRYTPHPSHINVETALKWINEYRPKQAVLTNLHIDLDYQTLNCETPDHVEPAYDGMQIRMHIDV
ncbi:phosphoribosyl 1,2-cyclic phosphodiesterase [Amylibacter marinus]|uniref:Phosphoribosyl 1,2-cyclic phosphodiesterase n=1 Tax=Amylibacter marinus TaxID=1475483 RepID=A0ABQ5VRD2_9RHOB|nr:MBL fold metallo-hydrolase [Amylibacter marinus]GLQ33968.1 phosphoribosyl 1,2-cyclic phosphodiesterase [Amylibacter marinus]